MIYLDNNATTAVDPAVREAMLPYLESEFANPSSLYAFARPSSKVLIQSREKVAGLIGAHPDEIIFAGCATEANNAALFSAVRAEPGKRHVVTTRVEHASVLGFCRQLIREGFEVTYLDVDDRGQIDLASLQDAIRRETAVVSIMMANNETGILLPVEKVGAICRERHVLFHTDAVQAAGKVPVNVDTLHADMLSLSAHKLHGPKGIGVLYCRRETPFTPFVIGGEQEFGRRGGTENIPGIAGFGMAADLAAAKLTESGKHMTELRDHFERSLAEALPNIIVTGQGSPRLPNTSNVLFEGLESDAILSHLDMADICCSSGSACASGSSEPSHVLEAMGIPRSLADGVVRVSSSRFNTMGEIDYVVGKLRDIVGKLGKESAARPG